MPLSSRLFAVLAVVILAGAPPPPPPVVQSSPFAAQIAAMSEPEGYFDTDNLISNERAYLSVLPALDARARHGGAYLGVGPDQNFSYIARVRPSVAFIIDIRRDNLLLHLLFKALFERSATRMEYLARLFGRPVPPAAVGRGESIERMTAWIDGRRPDAAVVAALRQTLDAAVAGFGVELSRADFATIDRFHRAFIDAGLDLRFHTTGRPPQLRYPTYRELLLAEAPDGTKGSFLASDEAFAVVKSLQARNLVIPVVGDLAGPKALKAVGAELRRRRTALSVFYTSNVEHYLARSGRQDAFLANLAGLPRAPGAVMLRSIFGGYDAGSRSVAVPMERLLAQVPQ